MTEWGTTIGMIIGAGLVLAFMWLKTKVGSYKDLHHRVEMIEMNVKFIDDRLINCTEKVWEIARKVEGLKGASHD